MSINLLYLVERNGLDLKGFLSKNKINSYEALLDYCQRKGCTPVTREEYETAAVLLKSNTSVKLEDAKKVETKKKPVSSRSTNTNKARKKKSNRSTD